MIVNLRQVLTTEEMDISPHVKLRQVLTTEEMDISPQMQEDNKAAARAAQKVGKGHLGRAAHALASNSTLASCGDEALIAQLRALHPALPANSTTSDYPIIDGSH